ncbi:BTAD domain-containing putative transcriptional regulator [Nocardia sp. NPDC057668]|uniref:BTAD domain-containing putative transcriptional regulator n=1 Tax=Nocardia sp. NPDC057668 TaxID=3346202 RepID=UPI00367114CD
MGRASALQLILLDGVEARIDGEVRSLGPPQRRGILAVLAMRRRQWVSAAALLTALYEDEPPASGTAVIQTHISALRRVLEPTRAPRTPAAVLLSGHGGYQLRIDDDQVDLGVLERLVAEADRARRADDGELAARRYAEALALCSGEPLAGIPGPWAEQQRAALTERRLAILEDSLELAVARGRADQAIDTLRGLTNEHPLRERPRAVLMRALADRGRRSEALAVYRDTRRLLVDELGVEPGAELRALQDRILAGWEAVPPTPPVAPASAGSAAATPAKVTSATVNSSTATPATTTSSTATPATANSATAHAAANSTADIPAPLGAAAATPAALDSAAATPATPGSATATLATAPPAVAGSTTADSSAAESATATPAPDNSATATQAAVGSAAATPAALDSAAVGSATAPPAVGSAAVAPVSIEPAAAAPAVVVHADNSSAAVVAPAIGSSGMGLIANGAVPTPDTQVSALVDRDRELAELAALQRRAAAGAGGLVVITGRPGYGKTALLRELSLRSPRASSIELTAGNEDLAGELTAVLVRAAATAAGGRNPGGVLPHGTSVTTAGRDGELAIAGRLREALGELGSGEAVLVLVDGAEVMDERSVRVLIALAPALRRSRALIVMALDGRFWDPGAVELHARLEPVAVAVLRLRRLGLAAVGELYRRRTGVACPPELAAEIAAAGADIPLLVDALIADIGERGDRGRVPEQLLDGRYSRATQLLLRGFSARGSAMTRALAALDEFEPGVTALAAACDQPPSEVRHRCELLTDAGILAAAEPPRFRHRLIATTLHWLGSLGESARFRTAAAEHERGRGYSARRVARYLRDLCGPEFSRWTVVLVDAAEECLRECVIVEAVRWLELALRICTPEQRDELLVRLGQVQLWTNPAAARAHLTEALLGQRAHATATTAAVPLAWTMAIRGEASAAMRMLDAVVAETEDRDPHGAAAIRASMWMIAGLSAQTWRELVAAQRDRAAPDLISASVMTWSDAFGVRIDARTAVRALAPGHADGTLPSRLLGLLAHLRMWAGELDTALTLTEQRADQHFGAIDTYRVILRSEIMLRAGDFRGVLAELGPVLGDIDDELIAPPAAVVAQYAHALIGLGRLREAGHWLDRRTAGASPETWEWTVVLHIRGLLCAARGESRAAIGYFLECGRRAAVVGITNPAHIPWRSAAAMEFARLGELDRARELADEELALAERWNTPATIGRALRARASAAPDGPAANMLDEAVTILRTQNSPVELIPALIDLARALHATGDPTRPAHLLGQARELAARIGARELTDIDTMTAAIAATAANPADPIT